MSDVDETGDEADAAPEPAGPDPAAPPAPPVPPADPDPAAPPAPPAGLPDPAEPAPRPRRRRVVGVVAVLAVALLAGGAALVALLSGSSPTRDLPAWDELDTRWGTYLSEREWGTPREAVGGNGWGLDYLDAIKTQYRYGEDGIAGLTTRDGAFAIGWATWDGKQVRVAERHFGWSGPSGPNNEAIVDRRTFAENTPTSSYHRSVFEYPAAEPRFEITFEGARADERSGILSATATNTAADAAPLDLVLKGWFHDPALRAELIPNGLLLRGSASVVAIVGAAPTSSQVSDAKRALDANLRDGGLTGSGPGHIGGLHHRLELDAGASETLRFAWAEETDAADAQARAAELLADADEIVAFRRGEADGLFRGAVTEHEDLYRQALASLLWSQSLYTWDGASSYAPAWEGRVDAHDVLIMPDTWEFPWLASWDTGFQAVVASLIDLQLASDQLRFILGDRWQQPSGAIPCAEWIMGTDCPPVFAWAAWRVHESGAGADFLREVYPGLQRSYDYWWESKAVEPAGLFTWGFAGEGFTKGFRPGMDNLPWAVGQAAADATGFMALSARYLEKIAGALGDAEGAARYAADLETIGAAVNARLWDEGAGFYFDLDTGGRSFIPTKSYSGLVPLIAGIVPPERAARVLEAVRDPLQLLSPAGVRSVSARSVIYEPGYAQGYNSNWRGPVWVPINYLLVEALEPLDAALAADVRERVVGAVEADWRATGRFHEYFDGDTGEGIGADAQAGWTALVANLVAEGWPADSAAGATPAPATTPEP